MKKPMFSRKKLILVLVPAVLLLIPFIFLGYVYFSPGRVRNFPIGKNKAQVNVTPGGVNIFYPKDDTTFYYFHNFSGPSQITNANTKLDDLSFSETYSSGWSLSSFINQLVPFSQKVFKLPSQESADSEAKNPIEQIFPKEQKFTSQLIDLTLDIPPGYKLSSDNKIDYEYMNVYKDSENQMALNIFPAAKGCVDSDYSSGRWDPLRIKIGGKYQITFTHGSISHGESGHSYAAEALANNDYCISATMNINLLNQKEFTNILEGK